MIFLLFTVQIKVITVHGILGGRNVNITDAPYQVNYADKCGAVLIHKKWALTTAHCGSDGTYIRIGSKHRLKGRKARILYHLIHPKYQLRHEFDYDVQLLELYRRLHFGKLVRSAELGGRFDGTVNVYGWGYSKEKGDYNEILQGIKIKVVPLAECQEVQQSLYNHTLTSRMFCAGGEGQDACQGDSGGAAISSGLLVGLSSFGYGCGRSLPGVYTDLSENGIRDWIEQHVDLKTL